MHIPMPGVDEKRVRDKDGMVGCNFFILKAIVITLSTTTWLLN